MALIHDLAQKLPDISNQLGSGTFGIFAISILLSTILCILMIFNRKISGKQLKSYLLLSLFIWGLSSNLDMCVSV